MTATNVTCECGAVYRREVQRDIVRDTDSFNCMVCGRQMELWSTSRWPRYTLISKPDTPKKRPSG